MNTTAFYFFENKRSVSVIIFAQMVGARSTSCLRAAGGVTKGASRGFCCRAEGLMVGPAAAVFADQEASPVDQAALMVPLMLRPPRVPSSVREREVSSASSCCKDIVRSRKALIALTWQVVYRRCYHLGGKKEEACKAPSSSRGAVLVRRAGTRKGWPDAQHVIPDGVTRHEIDNLIEEFLGCLLFATPRPGYGGRCSNPDGVWPSGVPLVFTRADLDKA